MKLVYLIGASGSGKTTTAKILEKENLLDLQICHSDSIGVPSQEEMVKEYGSGKEWQRANTIRWVKIIREEYLASKNVILDIQTRPSFIEEASRVAYLSDYKVVLFDCSDAVRTMRLNLRGQTKLANQQMMDWGRYLRRECEAGGYEIVDTSDLSIDECASALRNTLN